MHVDWTTDSRQTGETTQDLLECEESHLGVEGLCFWQGSVVLGPVFQDDFPDHKDVEIKLVSIDEQTDIKEVKISGLE